MISALVYPTVLVALSIAMIVVMTIFVMPKFTGFFDELDIELPLLTRIMLGDLDLPARQLAWIVLGVGRRRWSSLRRWSRDDRRAASAIDRVKLRLPLLGPVLHRFALSEFRRSLSTLLAGGIPLVPALEIAISAVGNRCVRGKLEPADPAGARGQARSTGARAAAASFADLAIDMVKVGEATGALDDMLHERRPTSSTRRSRPACSASSL